MNFCETSKIHVERVFVPVWSFALCIKNNTKIQRKALCTVEEIFKPHSLVTCYWSYLGGDFGKTLSLIWRRYVFCVVFSILIFYFLLKTVKTAMVMSRRSAIHNPDVSGAGFT